MTVISNIESTLSHTLDQANKSAHYARERASHAANQSAKTLGTSASWN